MKFVFATFTLLFSLLTQAGVAGMGGGAVREVVYRGNNLASAWVCNRGEEGIGCNWVTFKIRPQTQFAAVNQPTQCVLHIGEEGVQSCPAQYGTVIQKWMGTAGTIAK